MSDASECLFCRIAAGDIPSTRVYEDERTIAFMDINPGARGHLPGQTAGASGEAGARRGLSPRAGLMLLSAARAWALLAGRPMVVPEDVQAVFPAVAGHRLAGGARAGALQAQNLIRAVALP